MADDLPDDMDPPPQSDGARLSPRNGTADGCADEHGDEALAQVRHAFLRGCGLLDEAGAPAAWRGAARWSVLDGDFGLGLKFLTTWYAWQQQADRPARLFYTAVTARPRDPQDLVSNIQPFPELVPLAAQLAAQWHGMLPGVHRLRLDGGRVQLTLAVGDVQPLLAELTGDYDSLFLDGSDPDIWRPHTLKAVARLARSGARVAARCVPTEARERLVACGFDIEPRPGPSPTAHALRATYAPRWTPRPRRDAAAHATCVQPARCAVVGAGLAGASVARALALRGWQVTVLDRTAPAAGASGLPAGVVAAHVSPDDRPLSRLTRAGARATLATARELLREGLDFGVTGVLERHGPGERRLPADWASATSPAQRPGVSPADTAITQDKARNAHLTLDSDHPALWHADAGWLRPAALVQAMLQTPGVHWHGPACVARLARAGALWHLQDGAGHTLAEAELVVLTAGFDSLALLQSAPGQDGATLPLHALRGQVAFGPMPGGAADDAMPRFPVNGLGSLIAHLPGPAGDWWVTGSTFERGNPAAEVLAQDHAHNRQRLAQLLPEAAAALDAQWQDGRAQAWVAVRATLPDRLPAVGAWWPNHEEKPPLALAGSAQIAIKSEADTSALPVHLLTGLGARGLTLSLLAADILAAWMHAEPLPIERSLAQRLRASRWWLTRPARP